jgi:hypothetical protein
MAKKESEAVLEAQNEAKLEKFISNVDTEKVKSIKEVTKGSAVSSHALVS